VPWADVRGGQLYYERFGDHGPTLVVAHGLLNSIELTARFGERLDRFAAEGLRVIAYDARGHGRSSGSSRRRDYWWSALADDMAAFIEKVAAPPVAVYGGSMGAGTALLTALEYPAFVDRLMLRAPPPFGDDIKVAQSIFAPFALMLRVFGPRLTARIIGRLSQARRAQRPAGFDLGAFVESQRRDSAPAAIEGLLFGERLPTHRFDRIEQPTLVIAHPDDPIHPVASAERLHRSLPQARLVMAPDFGYWAEHPEELARLVGAFVKGAALPGVDSAGDAAHA